MTSPRLERFARAAMLGLLAATPSACSDTAGFATARPDDENDPPSGDEEADESGTGFQEGTIRTGGDALGGSLLESGGADPDEGGSLTGNLGGATSGSGGAEGAQTGGSHTGGAQTGGGDTGGSHAGGSPGAGGLSGAGGSGEVKGVISAEIIPDLSLEDFTEMCDEAGGVVEIHSHCGGVVTGRGFSYDSGTDVFTEHTCAGYNTCTGFSCVLDD